MIKNSLKQIGSIHIIVVSVITLVLLAGVGYVFWANFMKPQDESARQTSSETTSMPETATQPAAEETTPEADNDALKLADWNIQFTIPSSLGSTEVEYVARTSNDTPPVQYYAFTTARIKALGGKCTERTFGDTVQLNRFSEKPIAVPDGTLLNETPINGYYYAINSPPAYCSGFDASGAMQAPNQVEVEDRAGIDEMARSLKAIN